ncbi:MAG: response regulator, partial [Leptospiraceae bacterium]|nr:response regulator [Leptospiraceae bacterium]
RLEQVLLNLINNAIKFSDRGSVRITAKISASNPQLAEIAVIDTGIGIPANEQAHIFESFTQVYPQTGRKASGTGLGLSITRRLVELHGGRIAVHSRPHEGATFTFTLPLAPIPIDQSLESTPDRSTDSQPARTARQSIDDTISIFRTDATLTIPRRQPTEVESNVNFEVVNENPADKQSVRTDSRQNTHPWILLVDDDPINLEVMHDHLQLARYKTRSTSDPLQARDILNTEAPPDLIVLDMMMPFISGLDLAREIRTQYDLLTVPILMVTARAHTADLLAAMDAGANDYITRPFEREEFIMRVQNLVELSRNRHLNLTSESRIIEATRLERARINSELHDHLGASLTDLVHLSKTALKNENIDAAFAEKLYARVKQAVHLLRTDMLDLESIDLLEADFLDGLNLILLRRYVDADREIDFQSTVNEPLILPEPLLSTLNAIYKEIATNDIKYGRGRPRWEFSILAGELLLNFTGLSEYKLARHGTGRGTSGLLHRLSTIGGSMQISMDDDAGQKFPYSIQIRVRVPIRMAESHPRVRTEQHPGITT